MYMHFSLVRLNAVKHTCVYMKNFSFTSLFVCLLLLYFANISLTIYLIYASECKYQVKCRGNWNLFIYLCSCLNQCLVNVLLVYL